MRPVPTRKRFTDRTPERKNASWTAFRALDSSGRGITAEMLSSEDPCAMATMLTPLRPREWKTFPAIPGVCFIREPTTAMMERSFSIAGGSIAPSAISRSNSSLIAVAAIIASLGTTAKQIENSLEAWVMSITLTRFRARQPKRREENPVTPTMPEPWTRRREMSLMELTPRTG